MPRARLNGVDLHYQRFGAGPAVVLLHGLTANLAFWHPAIVTGLARERSVALLDFRGHGRSESAASGYTTRALAEDVLALLDHLEVERAPIVGHSWGGAVALHAAVLAPERVSRVVLADARVPSLQPLQALDTWEDWARIDERLRAHGIEIGADVLRREFGLLGELARLRVAGALDGVDLGPFFLPFATGSRKAAERWLALVRDTAILAELGEVAGLTPEAIGGMDRPTLAIYGERSHCRPTQQRLAKLLPRSIDCSVPDVGHFHPLVKPGVFLEETQRFLADAEPASALRPARSGG